MARTQIKLLIFLIALGIMVGCLLAAFWVYQNILRRDAEIRQDIAQIQSQAPGRPVIDPGARRFEAAIDLIRQGKIDEARDALYKLVQQFPKSPSCLEARRIIGEINMDALYRLDQSGGKKDYIVQPRDALLGIASKNHTTLEALARINSLTTLNLQPGEHLFVIPMEFDLLLDVSDKRLTVLRAGRFFKEYHAADVKLPQGMKVPVEMQVTSKSAIANNKAANPVSAEYVTAEKRVVAAKSANSVGLMLRAATSAGAGEEGVAASGVFLAGEDLEEIFPLLRKGSTLNLVQ